MRSAKQWQRIGSLFQIPMGALYVSQILCFPSDDARLWVFRMIGHAGLAIFAWCLWVLYIRRGRLNGLITTGPFRYTRNPMYLGLLVANLGLFAGSGLWGNPLFLAGELTMIALLIAAGYCQEQETLQRFGAAAVEYYKRTPRIPFTPW